MRNENHTKKILVMSVGKRVVRGNISTEINNKFPEIFPCGNFWEYFKEFLGNLKN